MIKDHIDCVGIELYRRWKEVKLGELITFQRGHDLNRTKMGIGQYPVAGSNGKRQVNIKRRLKQQVC